ncbi:Flagellar hook-associated protein FlgK [Citrifermentans bremense]|uniref:Flagellar hook-associated protein 1 n=1 Tax=Citrifermentans bremense TaxID=60035 RepID=A0A6S6MBR2_9BACT|nr:flagellar hook-associated protein FlgK [Citrifermentans bremense]BCG48895.1 Flagellar hook-associated protein FlgK [Citrifermentans bremense]
MSLNSLLSTGLSSLNAQMLAIEVTGENITNVNTPGYSRQTAMLVNAPTTLFRSFPMGNGVKVSAVQRSYDSFLQGQMMVANSSSGQAKTVNSALQMVQPLYNELTTEGLGQTMQQFFSTWQDLAANPQGVPERQSILSVGQQLVEDFHRINTSLVSVKDNMNQSLEQVTSDINDALKQIAQLNVSIKQIETGQGVANELRDQRELVVRQLSEMVGVTFKDETDGSVSVNLLSGQSLVSGKDAASLSLSTNVATGYYDVMLTPPGGGPAANATAFIGGPGNTKGEIGGMLQIRDTTINKYIADLDELAYSLANQMNAQHSAGYGLTGTQMDFFSPAAGTAPPVPAATAAGYSALIQVNLTSANQVAAADTNPALGGTGNNLNALSIAALYNKSLNMSTGNATPEAFYNSMVGKVGVDVQGAERGENQTGAIVSQLNNQRESVAGVSLDEELVNLTKYQKAYEGAARVINVGTEMMDTVLGLIK